MELYSHEEIERVNKLFHERTPISVRSIDFKNPYYTQPKSIKQENKKQALLNYISGAKIHHLYVHVPFCMTRCFYCHYPRTVGDHSRDNQNTFLEQLIQELDFYKDKFNFDELKTIHIGGGTPNILDADLLKILMEKLRECFWPSIEYAVEIYPSEKIHTMEKLTLIHDYGVDRISIGIQTFDDAVNEKNQRYDQFAGEVKAITVQAKKLFPNISIDLLYGQKTQTIDGFLRDLEQAYELNVNSIYLYQTRELIKQRVLELQAALNQFLQFYKDRNYEIVSFDQVIKKRNADGFCHHRSGRSKGESLLGIGPGAVTEIGPYIYKNISPERYYGGPLNNKCNNGSDKIDEDSIVYKDGEVLKREYLNRSLRHFNHPQIDGIANSEYHQRFNSDLYLDFGDTLDFLNQQGIVTYNPERLEITSFGMLFTQQINYMLLQHYK